MDPRSYRQAMEKAETVHPGNLEGRARYFPGRNGSQDLATSAEGQGAGARQGTQTPEIQTATELEDLETTEQDQRHPGQDSGQVTNPQTKREREALSLREALRRLARGQRVASVRRSERHYHPKSTSRHS